MRIPSSLIRWISGGILLGLAGFLGVVLTQHLQSQRSSPVPTVPVFDDAETGMEGFVYRHTEEGEIQWEVEARKARVDDAQRHAALEDIQVQLFGEDGRTMRLEAEEGTLDTVTSNFDLRNRRTLMEIEFANGYTILSPHIRWDDEERALRTHAPVTIHGHGLTITGTGLLGTLTTETLTVLDDVRVRMASSI